MASYIFSTTIKTASFFPKRSPKKKDTQIVSKSKALGFFLCPNRRQALWLWAVMLVVYVVLKRGATRPPVDPHMTRSKCSEADKAPSTKSYIRPIPVAVAEKPLYFSTTSTKKRKLLHTTPCCRPGPTIWSKSSTWLASPKGKEWWWGGGYGGRQ